MKLLDISKNIDEYTLQLYETVTGVSTGLGIDFFVVGATARDIILERGFQIRPFRATEDIDLGVQVNSWAEFAMLKQGLLDTGKFSEIDEREERVLYQGTHPIDIIPFGNIGSGEDHILWPPEHAIRMSIEGFQECYENAIKVLLRIEPEMSVRVASLAGIAVLKIFSWRDRGMQDDKDAKDLAILLQNYANAGNEDRLFGEEEDLMTQEDFDQDTAGARLLGRDVACICKNDTRRALCRILEPELDLDGNLRMIKAMMRTRIESNFERLLLLLRKFYFGIEEA